jgi:hypothetical protein
MKNATKQAPLKRLRQLVILLNKGLTEGECNKTRILYPEHRPRIDPCIASGYFGTLFRLEAGGGGRPKGVVERVASST